MGTGRKSGLTKAIQAEIIEILEEGNYQKTAFEIVGVPTSTYYYWLKTGENAQKKLEEKKKITKTERELLEFSEAVKKAIQGARRHNLAVIKKATEGGDIISERKFFDKDGNVTQEYTVYSTPNWQAAAWFLERTSPDEYGKRERVDHSFDDDKPFRVVWDKPGEKK